MSPARHVLASTVVSAGVYAATDSWASTLLSWAGGFLIDIDHALDYCVLNHRMASLSTISDFYKKRRFSKVFLWFHAVEWIPLIAGIGWWTGQRSMTLAFLIGYCHHLLFDWFTNGGHPLLYLISFRLKHRFEPGPLGVAPAKKTSFP